jgi:hypothetical protein
MPRELGWRRGEVFGIQSSVFRILFQHPGSYCAMNTEHS